MHNIGKDRLSYEGYADNQPIADNSSTEEEPKTEERNLRLPENKFILKTLPRLNFSKFNFRFKKSSSGEPLIFDSIRKKWLVLTPEEG